MVRKPKDPSGESVRAISIVLTNTQLKNLDSNVTKMQEYLIGKGIPEPKVRVWSTAPQSFEKWSWSFQRSVAITQC